MITREELGMRLRLARTYRKLTQERAGQELNLSKSAISLMESGKREVKALDLMRLARLYRLPIQWFFLSGINPAIWSLDG